MTCFAWYFEMVSKCAYPAHHSSEVRCLKDERDSHAGDQDVIMITRQTDRQTDEQTDGQTDRQTNR